MVLLNWTDKLTHNCGWEPFKFLKTKKEKITKFTIGLFGACIFPQFYALVHFSIRAVCDIFGVDTQPLWFAVAIE